MQIAAWIILVVILLCACWGMAFGGGEPSGNPHDPGIGGSLYFGISIAFAGSFAKASAAVRA